MTFNIAVFNIVLSHIFTLVNTIFCQQSETETVFIKKKKQNYFNRLPL